MSYDVAQLDISSASSKETQGKSTISSLTDRENMADELPIVGDCLKWVGSGFASSLRGVHHLRMREI